MKTGDTVVLIKDICVGLEKGTQVVIKSIKYGTRAQIKSPVNQAIGARSVSLSHLLTIDEFNDSGWWNALGQKPAVRTKTFKEENYTVSGLKRIRSEMAFLDTEHPEALSARELFMLRTIETLMKNNSTKGDN